MSNDSTLKAFDNAWNQLTPEERREVASPGPDGVSDETFRKLIVKAAPPLVALVGFTSNERDPSKYVREDFAEYVRERLE